MSHQINLPENLTIHHINDQFSELKESISTANEDVVFDAGAIDSIDTSGLQMLAVFVKNLEERNIDFSWQNANDVLKDTTKSLGLSETLRLS
jgi:anti-anti-sigma regulatory factor